MFHYMLVREKWQVLGFVLADHDYINGDKMTIWTIKAQTSRSKLFLSSTGEDWTGKLKVDAHLHIETFLLLFFGLISC